MCCPCFAKADTGPIALPDEHHHYYIIKPSSHHRPSSRKALTYNHHDRMAIEGYLRDNADLEFDALLDQTDDGTDIDIARYQYTVQEPPDSEEGSRISSYLSGNPFGNRSIKKKKRKSRRSKRHLRSMHDLDDGPSDLYSSSGLESDFNTEYVDQRDEDAPFLEDDHIRRLTANPYIPESFVDTSIVDNMDPQIPRELQPIQGTEPQDSNSRERMSMNDDMTMDPPQASTDTIAHKDVPVFSKPLFESWAPPPHEEELFTRSTLSIPASLSHTLVDLTSKLQSIKDSITKLQP
ncbi:hypothetical protein BZG36_01187 [Bifiguratus adelaidae]|uniref:Uncharacterized protein n=1 Tax=Bifiguratus adelaidae TaxID=1938954 RepID=A0A261Y5U6_9FUNG|nr:hypothetical protein BZG36_01187 [Bifiguratus adelaidae]